MDPEGRTIDASGDKVNKHGQRVGDDGQPLDDGDGDVLGGAIPPIPPMMGR